jgi:bifunctional DNase/RNase
LRVNAPIFAAEEVIQESKPIDLKAELEDKSEQGKMKGWMQEP